MTNLANKIGGALFGVAVGDALGAPLEFMNAKEIQHKHGTVKEMIGGGWLSVKPGEVTEHANDDCSSPGRSNAPR